MLHLCDVLNNTLKVKTTLVYIVLTSKVQNEKYTPSRLHFHTDANLVNCQIKIFTALL